MRCSTDDLDWGIFETKRMFAEDDFIIKNLAWDYISKLESYNGKISQSV